MGSGGIFEQGLDANPANFQPQTPLGFLDWAEGVYPDKTAVIHGAARYTYRQFGERCRRLASALQKRSIGPGDTVAVMAPNSPPMLEAHFGVPMSRGCINLPSGAAKWLFRWVTPVYDLPIRERGDWDVRGHGTQVIIT